MNWTATVLGIVGYLVAAALGVLAAPMITGSDRALREEQAAIIHRVAVLEEQVESLTLRLMEVEKRAGIEPQHRKDTGGEP